MLIIDSKDCENIDKALKKYKKKFEKAKILLQLRERQSFTKPSVRRRGQVLRRSTSSRWQAERSRVKQAPSQR
jgi:small subunit ribosomal protein S21